MRLRLLTDEPSGHSYIYFSASQFTVCFLRIRQDSGKIFCRHRSEIIISLQLITALLDQKLCRFFCLHALAYDCLVRSFQQMENFLQQLGQGDMQRSTCLRILNRPERYIPRNALRGHLLDWEESIQTADCFVAGRLCQLQREICGLQSLAPAAALY